MYTCVFITCTRKSPCRFFLVILLALFPKKSCKRQAAKHCTTIQSSKRLRSDQTEAPAVPWKSQHVTSKITCGVITCRMTGTAEGIAALIRTPPHLYQPILLTFQITEKPRQRMLNRTVEQNM